MALVSNPEVHPNETLMKQLVRHGSSRRELRIHALLDSVISARATTKRTEGRQFMTLYGRLRGEEIGVISPYAAQAGKCAGMCSCSFAFQAVT
eukprot:s323_g6.t1